MSNALGDFFKGLFISAPSSDIPDPPVNDLKEDEVVSQAIITETEKVLEDEETACPVCFDQYASPGQKEPVTTTCGHTLCRDCYKTLKLDDAGCKDCPTCRHKIMSVEDPNQTILITQLIDKYNLVVGQMKKLLRVVKTPNLEAELRQEITKELKIKYQADLNQALSDALVRRNRETADKIKLVVEAKDNAMIERLGRLKNEFDQEKMVAVQTAAHDAGERLHAENCKLTLDKEALESRLEMYDIVKNTSGVDLADLVNRLQNQLAVERDKLEMTKAGLKIELNALRRLVNDKEEIKNGEADELHRLKQQVFDLQKELKRHEVNRIVGDNESYAREMKILRDRLAELEISNESKSRYINDLKAEVLKSKGPSVYQVERTASPDWDNGGGGRNNNNNPWGGRYASEEGTVGRTGKFFTHKNS